MIQSGLASFVVHSVATDPDVVTELLGIVPTEIVRRGTVLRSGRVREHHHWDVAVDFVYNDENDQTGTGALRQLLERLRPAEGRVAELPADCEARIWWSAYSDSVQGGFVLKSELTARIAALGVDLFATAYLDEEEAGTADGA